MAHGWHFLALGWAGVDLFFCLSGFLIGGILMDNRNSPSYFSTFYIRRGFQIFPIYYVMVSLVLAATLWQRARHPGWIDPVLPAASYYIYSQNLLFAIVGDQSTAWLLPTWTLCVEEQFYLLLPLILYFVPRGRLPGALLLLIASASLWRLTLFVCGANDMALRVLLPSRWDLLFLGVLAAYLYRDRCLWDRLVARNRRPLKWGIVLGATATVALVMADRHFAIKSFDRPSALLPSAASRSSAHDQRAVRHRFRSNSWFNDLLRLYLVVSRSPGCCTGLCSAPARILRPGADLDLGRTGAVGRGRRSVGDSRTAAGRLGIAGATTESGCRRSRHARHRSVSSWQARPDLSRSLAISPFPLVEF
jgi:hypothetical protein